VKRSAGPRPAGAGQGRSGESVLWASSLARRGDPLLDAAHGLHLPVDAFGDLCLLAGHLESVEDDGFAWLHRDGLEWLHFAVGWCAGWMVPDRAS
jgi:hypothetical protein